MKSRLSLIVPVLLVSVLALLASCGGAAGSASVATVEWLEGSVTVDGRSPAIGDQVPDGSVIVTGEDSLAELTFGDYRILRVTSNSRLVIDSGSREMKLDAGAVAVVQARARKIGRDRSWRLRTPTTVAAVRGTVYYARVEDPDHTYFCLCNGKIHLEETEAHTTLDLEAAHHQAARFVRTDSGIVYTDAPMLYHDDADMESLADKVHVPIDWSNITE